MYTTLGAPSGALGGSKGAQSGTESRMSTPTVPLNALLIGSPGLRTASSAPVLAPRALAVRLGSVAEQLGLGGGELLVGQRALLTQLVELVELIDHGRSLCRGRLLGGRGLLVLLRLLLVLLLLEVGDALVLFGLRVRLLFPSPARV